MQSSFPIVLGAVLGAALLSQECLGASNALSRKELKNIKVSGNQSKIRLWDNQVVAVPPKGSSEFYSFTAKDPTPRKIIVAGLDRIVSLGEGAGASLALGRTGGAWLLMEKQNGGWSQVSIPPEMQSVFRPLLIPSTAGIAILTENTLYHRIDGNRWLQFSLPEIPELNLQFFPEKWGVEQRLFNTELFVAWDDGEWGGMVLKFDLLEQKKGWQTAVGAAISAMSVDRSGKLWVAGGGGMGEFRYLSFYDCIEWHDVVRGEFDENAPGTLVLPGRVSDIGGIFSSHAGTLYVLAGSIGVLTCSNGKFTPLLDINFNTVKHCQPKGLVVDAAANLFVHSNAFDVFCFFKKKNHYSFLQVIFPPATEIRVSKKASIAKYLGDSQRRKKEFGPAITAYTRAISEVPAYVDALEGRAAAKEAMGQIEEGRKDREAALRIEDEAQPAGKRH